MPPHITFEVLTKGFMDLCADRYYSSAKVLDVANRIVAGGVSSPDKEYQRFFSVYLKIVILSRFRDAVREVALLQIFETPQRRDELYMAIIEALEDLEDEYEEIEAKYAIDND